MIQNEDPFVMLLSRYKEAVLSKDVESFLSIYSKDLHVFDMWGAWSLQGLEAWRAMAEGWFSSLGTERVAVTVEEVRSEVGERIGFAHAILTFTALSENGDEIRSLNSRMSVGLQLEGDSWKIVHEHTSAPIDHQSLKACLKRETEE